MLFLLVMLINMLLLLLLLQWWWWYNVVSDDDMTSCPRELIVLSFSWKPLKWFYFLDTIFFTLFYTDSKAFVMLFNAIVCLGIVRISVVRVRFVFFFFFFCYKSRLDNKIKLMYSSFRILCLSFSWIINYFHSHLIDEICHENSVVLLNETFIMFFRLQKNKQQQMW